MCSRFLACAGLKNRNSDRLLKFRACYHSILCTYLHKAPPTVKTNHRHASVRGPRKKKELRRQGVEEDEPERLNDWHSFVHKIYGGPWPDFPLDPLLMLNEGLTILMTLKST